MATDLTALDDFRPGDVQHELPWAPFEMDLMEDVFSGVDMLTEGLGSHQLPIPSTTTEGTLEDTHGSDKVAGTNTEQMRTGGSASLVSQDMNDPNVLNDYASLLLFANNPSTHHFDLLHCDSSKQAIIQALAAKLDLQYSYDSSVGTIRLQKESYEQGLGQTPQNPRTGQGWPQSFRHEVPLPLPPPKWKPGQLMENPHGTFSTVGDRSPFSQAGVAMDIDTNPSEVNLGNLDLWGEDVNYSLATPHYQGLSEDEPDMNQISSQLPISLPRRSSWVALSRTLKEVGACWRCKILRKKCDPNQPCKACPSSGTSSSRWQTIGCKRGTLLDHMPHISLCPRANAPGLTNVDGTFHTTQPMPKIPIDEKVGKYLREASNRLDNLLASETDTYTKVVLEILCSPMSIVTDTPLSLRHDVEANSIHIAWGLIEVNSVKDILHITSVEHTLDVIKAAVAYETEYGLSQAVPMAIRCLRSCIEILRLQESGHLVSDLHDDCVVGHCQIQPFQDLSANIKCFTDELSKVLLRKENRLHERRWWLSAFYSIWIQSYVRRTIRFVENVSKVPLDPETKEACSSSFLLALELFDVTSATFDPLMSAWSLEEEPPHMDLKLMKYYRLAQKALLSNQWPHDIRSSIHYLSRLYHDNDALPAARFQGDASLSPISGAGHVDHVEGHTALGTRSFIFRTPKPSSRYEKSFLAPQRTNSGAKRRAESPLQDSGFIQMQRNGSSSSVLNGRDIRTQGLSIASPRSPMSSGYSFAYGTSNSTRWDGSADSLAEMAKLYGTSPPHARDQFDYLSPSKGSRHSLKYKSSNESFLELPRKFKEPRKLKEPSSATSTKSRDIRGFYICECCPKKPRRFQSAEELSAHEAEKRYECSVCGNRFKSKNEADRHHNSLHVRRHAWSCSNILSVGYTNVFQESISQPGVADTCGYCGEDFARNGGGSMHRQANDSDWEERLSHVREVHKFGECNRSKKFYRADHFRQHLKHSHSALSGRWTSVLETACMVDIPGPKDGP
ncbi:hypothetical protein GGR54DRAFT_633490 [Hypoxylon sp. NC1633]|nr:hypothetical protein GGR54DRAFT_633490 [Hypoxylon sp. NC1633]